MTDVRFHSGVSLHFAIGMSGDTACWGSRCGAAARSHQAKLLPYTSIGVGYAW